LTRKLKTHVKKWFADDPVIGKYRFSALVSDLDLPAELQLDELV